jgi:hypothetical protein
MQVDLDREDLENLLKGSNPYFTVMGDKIINRCGYYKGGFHDEWVWTSIPKDITDEEIYKAYQLCKNSWK